MDEVLKIHQSEITAVGGTSEIRDIDRLKSALGTAQAMFGGKLLMDLFEIAATYIYSIASNHPFLDGNKRVATASGFSGSCSGPPFFRCVASSPHQLTDKEVKAIAAAYKDPEKTFWSSYAIAATLQRDGVVVAGISTIQRYARALGLSKRYLRNKFKRRGSIVGSKINEYWHVDVTRLVGKDNVVHYLHLLMDNVSRKILGWRLRRKISARTTKEVVAEALDGLKGSSHDIRLVSDGGSENDNLTVREFLLKNDISLLIAQRDIHESNSMIEAVNKTIKYRHIFPHPMPEAKDLPDLVDRAIGEYNTRPHSALKGLTPGEVYRGVVFDSKGHRRLLDEARLKRMEMNRRVCPPCQGGSLESQGSEEIVGMEADSVGFQDIEAVG